MGLFHNTITFLIIIIIIWVNCTDSDIKNHFDFDTVHLHFMLYFIFLDFRTLFIISINVTDPKAIDQNFQVNWLRGRKKHKAKQIHRLPINKHIKLFHFKWASMLLVFILTKFYMLEWQSRLSSYQIIFKKHLMLLI